MHNKQIYYSLRLCQRRRIVYVCRHYFDMSLQTWMARDVQMLRTPKDLDVYLRDNKVTCLFAVDVLLCYGILTGTSESGVHLTSMLLLDFRKLKYRQVSVRGPYSQKYVHGCVVNL